MVAGRSQRHTTSLSVSEAFPGKIYCHYLLFCCCESLVSRFLNA